MRFVTGLFGHQSLRVGGDCEYHGRLWKFTQCMFDRLVIRGAIPNSTTSLGK